MLANRHPEGGISDDIFQKENTYRACPHLRLSGKNRSDGPVGRSCRSKTP
jgi:hypothetical protein